jgi:beta-galactosidase
LGQAYGYILYRTHLNGAAKGSLAVDGLHDYAQVYLDGKLAGTLDRRLDQKQLPLKLPAAGGQLDILVENTGRINFNIILRKERKGIVGQVTSDGKPVSDWDIYPLPMDQPAKYSFAKNPCGGACFYRATFQVDTPADTFLDTSAFTKGEVWLNGQPLGRVWNIGPQKTLYVPGPWLRKGENEVVVFDLQGGAGRTLVGRDKPILGGKAE